MRILGIDPGSLRCGYALLEDLGGRVPLVREAGTWTLGEGRPLPDRLARLQDSLDDLLERGRPEILSIEEAFVHKNVRSALVLGHARGVVLARCAGRGLSIHEYAPSSVKQAIAGSGRASKEAVADMVRRQLALEQSPTSPDSSDALAIALTHLSLSRGPFAQTEKASGNRRSGKFDIDSYLERLRQERSK